MLAATEEQFSVRFRPAVRTGDRAKFKAAAGLRRQHDRDGEADELHARMQRGAECEGIWETLETDPKGRPVVVRISLDHLTVSYGRRKRQLLSGGQRFIASETNGARTLSLPDGSPLEKQWPGEAVNAVHILFDTTRFEAEFYQSLEPKVPQIIGRRWSIGNRDMFTNGLPGELRMLPDSFSGTAQIAGLTNRAGIPCLLVSGKVVMKLDPVGAMMMQYSEDNLSLGQIERVLAFDLQTPINNSADGFAEAWTDTININSTGKNLTAFEGLVSKEIKEWSSRLEIWPIHSDARQAPAGRQSP